MAIARCWGAQIEPDHRTFLGANAACCFAFASSAHEWSIRLRQGSRQSEPGTATASLSGVAFSYAFADTSSERCGGRTMPRGNAKKAGNAAKKTTKEKANGNG